MPTRTGNFAIGFRRGWSDWFRKDFSSVAKWAKDNRFDAIDLGHANAADVGTLKAAGLALGSVDLLQMGDITHPDSGKRKDVLNLNVAYVKEAAGWGAKNFFTVVGADPSKKRSENYKEAVAAFEPLAEAAASVGGNIAVEGYPGSSPHLALLCTTPETIRAFLKDIPKGIAINYDPSHFIRLGVDHIRFLKEFAAHVVHVHGKDTELFPEAIYEKGLYQPSAFTDSHGFGEQVWRYTIPGHGTARWTEIFRILLAANYSGLVCVELEDENFNGTEVGEKMGLTRSLEFLLGV